MLEWARLGRPRGLGRFRQVGVVTLLFLLFFLILPTVWIQNVIMLGQLRSGHPLLALVMSNDSPAPAATAVVEDGGVPQNDSTFERDRRTAPPRPRPAPSSGGGARPLTAPEIGLVERLRLRTHHECRSVELPDGPAWKHPRLSARHTHEGRGAGGAPDAPLSVSAVLQYPNLLAPPAGRHPDAVAGAVPGGAERPATTGDIEERQREYHYALARTLLHPAVGEVHLLLNDTAADVPALLRGLAELCDLPAPLLEKLRVRGVGRLPTYGKLIAHANGALAPGAAALVLNSDTYPVGRGWGDLRAPHLAPRERGGEVLYMLSRYTPRCPPGGVGAAAPRGGRDRWRGWSKPEMCMDMGRRGSADALLFRVPTPARVAEDLRGIPTHYWGAENRAAAAFARAGYGRIYNPCNQLALWHRHCSGVRTAGPGVPRVNRGTGRSRKAKWIACLDDAPP